MFSLDIQNGKILRIFDGRYDEPIDITDGTGRFGYLAYTLKSEDINQQLHPGSMPFNEKHMGFDDNFLNSEFGTKLTIENSESGLILELTCDGADVDGAGLFLPFNFISRKNGYWEQQFTISSPYHTADYKHHLFYLGRPDGNNLVCIVENEIECFMVNYSPYQGGHFIRGITFWSQLDKAYGRAPREDKRVRVHILPVSNYIEAMKKACKIWNCNGLYYKLSSAYQGQEFTFDTIGKTDSIEITSPSGKKQTISDTTFIPEEYGFYQAVPYSDGKAGMDCTLFCMDSLPQMHARATKIIEQDPSVLIGKTTDGTDIYEPTHLTYRGYKDFNLCEHCMWAWSALKYLQQDGGDDRIHRDVRNLLNIMNPENNVKQPRCSFDPDDHYNTCGDYRIQEAFNGVSMLLDAYKLYGDDKFLQLAKTALRSKLEVDQLDDGGVYRYAGRGEDRHREDYTTVTAMILPVVNMALQLKKLDDPDWEYFKVAAIRMADHMVSRGMDFPTEGGGDPEVNVEVEEGSMSCTALTVLYVYAKLDANPVYLDFANKVLAMHDSYSVYTPHPCTFRSSLRWWETIWEGDSDGPAICFGHAWTIWRAEAEYWYGILARDDERLLDSYNSFMSNFSKTDKEGNMYAIYQYEQLSSPAMEDRGNMTDRTNQEGFPRRTDKTLSRYAWARAADTWFDTVAILPDANLMVKLEDGVMIPEYPDFKTLYIGDITGVFMLKAEQGFDIISSKKVTVEGDEILKITVTE